CIYMQKILDYRAPLCSLQGIKIHFCEFLYDFALKRNKLLDPSCNLAGKPRFPRQIPLKNRNFAAVEQT
ncbi:MAG: hypothetical protein LBP93_08485, partial [Treponema sp.]|nr:hypothetical protein [Treponema sp.]